MAITINESKLQQIIREEFRSFLNESDEDERKVEAPDEVSFIVKVRHRPGKLVEEQADAQMKAIGDAIQKYQERYDLSDNHGKGYKMLGRTKDGMVRYKIYLARVS